MSELVIYCAATGIICVLVMLGLFKFIESYSHREYNRLLKEADSVQSGLQKTLLETQEALKAQETKNKDLISLQKSKEVKMGQMTEHLVPFLEEFPYDPKDAKFLGMPTDLIVFDLEGDRIVFVEVKTGKARESSKQRKIRQLVKEGKVYYETFRLDSKGFTRKRQENDNE